MKAVVDSSVLVAALVDTTNDGLWAEEVISEGPLAAPELALAEVTNVLRRMELSVRLSSLEATASHRDLLRLDLDLYPFAPFADRVWALRANLTCYDAWYVALAEALDFPLVTLDRRIGRSPGLQCEVVLPQRPRPRSPA
ncbi:MAG: type II toxin-antitoxin system VapC family toxin [bacterium]|nr:type II toxin-antitoxin system VapC family toxin [bacterium]